MVGREGDFSEGCWSPFLLSGMRARALTGSASCIGFKGKLPCVSGSGAPSRKISRDDCVLGFVELGKVCSQLAYLRAATPQFAYCSLSVSPT